MISKTLYTQSIQCLKLAHRIVNNPSTLPQEDSLGILFRKNQGIQVGNLAKELYNNSIDLSNKPDYEKLQLTTQYKTKTLFEASASFEDLFARADILIPNNDNTHTIIEVKATTEVEEHHIEDVSFQYYVFTKAGYNIKECYIMHINKDYIKQGKIDPEKYFVKELIKPIPIEDNLTILKNTLKNKEPNKDIGMHCTKPFDCPLKKECWSFLPENNVTQLYYDKKTGFELLKQGITLIKDITTIDSKGRGKQERLIQIKATKNNEIYLNKEEIQNFLNTITKPIYYFDFETYAPAIPLFDKSRPYQRIPFQYSVHIEDNNLIHKEFLATKSCDPREELIKTMLIHLGKIGSIIVYNQAFEKSIIKELARDFPKYETELNNLLPRIIDLAYPFQYFHYYNPKQQGRYSIKVILPLFTNLSYKGMNVSNGEEAFCAFENILKGDLSKVNDLKEYCKLDTLAEVEIVKGLKGLKGL